MKRVLVLMIVLIFFLVACGEELETNMSKEVMDFELQLKIMKHYPQKN